MRARPTLSCSAPLLLAALALSTSGCQALFSLRDVVAGVVEPFAMQSTHVGVVPPEDPQLIEAISGSEYGSGVLTRLWPYDAKLGGEPDGLQPLFQGDASGGRVVMLPDPEGSGYRLDGEDGVRYTAGDEIEVEVSYEGVPRWIQVVAPEAPTVAFAKYHGAGEPIRVSLAGQDYTRALVMVLDVETSETLWSNLPSSADDIEGGARGAEALVVDIPGDVFGEESVYAVGVAGAVEAGSDDYAELNTAVSGFTAARFEFSTVCTFADPDLCDPPDEVPEDVPAER